MRFRSSRRSSRIASPGAQRRPCAARRLELEVLEERRLLAMFTPTTFSDGLSGGSQIKTLRDAVIAANADVGIATDSIVLGAGTYMLSLQQPVAGRENNATAGALAITSTKHEIDIEGQVDAHGNPTTIINASALNDRVFQIVSAGTTVVFKNLIIENGVAQDDGAGSAARERRPPKAVASSTMAGQ